MSVYVDELRLTPRFVGGEGCHMMADTDAELEGRTNVH